MIRKVGVPVLVVMGRDSESEGRVFESLHCILLDIFHNNLL